MAIEHQVVKVDEGVIQGSVIEVVRYQGAPPFARITPADKDFITDDCACWVRFYSASVRKFIAGVLEDENEDQLYFENVGEALEFCDKNRFEILGD